MELCKKEAVVVKKHIKQQEETSASAWSRMCKQSLIRFKHTMLDSARRNQQKNMEIGSFWRMVCRKMLRHMRTAYKNTFLDNRQAQLIKKRQSLSRHKIDHAFALGLGSMMTGIDRLGKF